MKRRLEIIGLGAALLASALAGAQTPYYSGAPAQYYPGEQLVPLPVAPRIHTIYAAPMMRSNEIPLYGKNKATYFYNAPKRDSGLFDDAGLYVFGAYASGSSKGGIVGENPFAEYGSDANASMGDAIATTIGVGRVMNRNFNVELFYTKVGGMRYGDFAQIWVPAESDEDLLEEDEDPEMAAAIRRRSARTGLETAEPKSAARTAFNGKPNRAAVENERVFGDEVVSGGDIAADFFGIGFQYKLDRMFGSFMGGMLKPYVGFQFGMTNNAISDYTLRSTGWTDDGEIYDIDDDGNYTGWVWDGECNNFNDPFACVVNDYSNADIKFKGAGRTGFGYGIEAGLTLEIEKNLLLEFFYRRTSLGKVGTSGQMIINQDLDRSYVYVMEQERAEAWDPTVNTSLQPIDIYLGDICSSVYGGQLTYLFEGDPDDPDSDQGICTMYDPTQHDVVSQGHSAESGTIQINQFGVKLKYLF